MRVVLLILVILLNSTVSVASIVNNYSIKYFIGDCVLPKVSFGKIIENDYVGLEHFIKEKSKPSYIIINSKESIPYKELYNHVKKIISQLPEIQDKENLIKLIVETAIVETCGGKYYDVTNQGGLGITQINIESARKLLEFLSKEKPQLYDIVESYRDKSLSFRENLINNLTYNLALCILYYYWNEGKYLYKQINSLRDRAFLWKRTYNTVKGKGTPYAYIQRVQYYK